MKRTLSQVVERRDCEKATMGKMYHVLVLLHMLLMAYVTSSWTEEQTYEADRYPSAEETLAQAMKSTAKEELSRLLGIGRNQATTTPHDYMLHIYEQLNGNRKAAQKSRFNSILGLTDSGFSFSPFNFY